MIKKLTLLKALPWADVWTIVYQNCITGEITTNSKNIFLLELINSYKKWKYLNWFSDRQDIQYELSDIEKILSKGDINKLSSVIYTKLNQFTVNVFWVKEFYNFVKNDIVEYTKNVNIIEPKKWFWLVLLEFILLSFVKEWLLERRWKSLKGKFKKK